MYELIQVNDDGSVELLATGTAEGLAEMRIRDIEDNEATDNNYLDERVVPADIRNCETGQAGGICDVSHHATVCTAAGWIYNA